MRSLLSLAFLLAFSFPALADIEGEVGKLIGLREIGSGSDNFSIIRGSIWVEERSKTVQAYHWGASNCVTSDLTEAEIANLSRGLDNSSLRIIPVYRPGQLPGTRCLLEFIFIEQQHADSVESAQGAI